MSNIATRHFRVGQAASVTRTITEADVMAFAEISGDSQPLHTDPSYGPRTRFKHQIAHGVILIGLVSGVLGREMAGPDYTVIFLGSNVNFTNPVYFGDEITATCRVTSVREDKPVVQLGCRCINQDGEEVLNGQAAVYIDPFPAPLPAAPE